MSRTVGRMRVPSPIRGVAATILSLASLLAAACHGPFSRIAPHARLDAVVRVEIGDEHAFDGTAFFVAPDVVATAYHVAAAQVFDGSDQRPPAALEVALEDGRRIAVRGVLGDDSEADVVCLKLSAPVPDVTPIRLSDAVPAPGQSITILGYPGGGAYAASTGRVVSSEMTGCSRCASWVETSARGSPGSSGSPMLDERGAVLAVASRGRRDDPAILGTRAERIRSLMLVPETPWREWADRARRSAGERTHAIAYAVPSIYTPDAAGRRRAEFVARLGLAYGQAPFDDEAELWAWLLSLAEDTEADSRRLAEADAWIARWPARTGARIAKITHLFNRERYPEVVAEYDRYREAASFRRGMGALAALAATEAGIPPRPEAAEEAVLEEPGWALAWRAVASARWAAGDSDRWGMAFLRYHALRPDDPATSQRLGALAMAHAMAGDATEALELADEALRPAGSPDDQRYARGGRVIALLRTREFDRAEALLADVDGLGKEWARALRARLTDERARASLPPK